MISLNARIGLGAGLVLTVFVVLTALALDRAFQQSGRDAMRERLLGQTYILMAAAELDPEGRLLMPAQLTEARFNLPESGLYAAIAVDGGEPAWRSASSAGLHPPFNLSADPGEHFAERRGTDNKPFHVLDLSVQWETAKRPHTLSFSVAEDLAPYYRQINGYRRSLWVSLGAMAVLLLLTQTALLRWGLRPLRAVGNEIKAIETGVQTRIEAPYPKELTPLTESLNALLRHERAQLSRYKDALADLAHSLKTPLAILRGLVGQGGAQHEKEATLEEQVARMDAIVAYQLQRAVTAGRSALATPVVVRPLVMRIVETIGKVYRDKGIAIGVEIPEDLAFRAEEGDLMEVFGNLLDNAAKWCRERVMIRAQGDNGQFSFSVEDDGPGVADEQVERMLKRGVRLDEATPGHGIGMAIVRDIVQAYEGHLNIERSALGGALIGARFVLR